MQADTWGRPTKVKMLPFLLNCVKRSIMMIMKAALCTNYMKNKHFKNKLLVY